MAPWYVGLYLLVLCSAVDAHPISLTSAEVKISRNKISIALTVMYEDLLLYHHLRPDAEGRISKALLNSTLPLHGNLIRDSLHLHDHQGARLEGTIIRVLPMPLAPQGLHVGELMAKTITYYLEYTTAAPLSLLTFFQLFPGGGSLPALMDLTVRQEGFSALPAQRLSNGGNSLSLAFSWKKSPRIEPRKISASQPMAEIKFAPSHARILFSLPLLMLEHWVKVPRKISTRLEVDEQEAIRPAVTAFFEGIYHVKIAGTLQQPRRSLVRFHSAADQLVGGEGKALGIYTAMATVEHEYLLPSPLVGFSTKMTIFNEVLYEVSCYVERAGVREKKFFTAYHPEIAF